MSFWTRLAGKKDPDASPLMAVVPAAGPPAAPAGNPVEQPGTWEHAYVEVMRAASEQRVEDCLAAAERCVHADGISADMVENCWVIAAQALTHARRFEDAVDYLNNHRDVESSSVRLAVRAAAFIGLGWYDEALPLAKAFLDRVEMDENGNGHAILGACLLGKGDVAPALAQLQQALAISPNAAVPNVVQANELALRCLFRLRRFEDAIQLLKKPTPDDAVGMLFSVGVASHEQLKNVVTSHAWAEELKSNPWFTELTNSAVLLAILGGLWRDVLSPATKQAPAMLWELFVCLILLPQAEFPAKDLDATLSELLSSAGIPAQMITMVKGLFGASMQKYMK